MRMLVICPFPLGVAAGQRLKFEQYYDDWRDRGWEVVPAPYMDMPLWNVLYERGHFAAKLLGVLKGLARRIGDMFRVRRYDLIYCHMYVTPVGTSVFERLTRRLARKLVFDVEDNVIIDSDRFVDHHPNRLLRFIRGAGKTHYLIRTADHVVTSSPALNHHCLKLNQKRACSYISSSVDTDRFVPAERRGDRGRVTIGWTGTFSTRVYLDLLRPVFQTLAESHDFQLRVIGNFDYALPGVSLDVIRWTAEREVVDLQGIDIGVYPLKIDEFVTGKSGLKAIQYMAIGLPCVATDIGTTPLIIRDGENGKLVRSEGEWLEALKSLIDDPDLRRRLGEQARRDAVAKYSTKAIAAEYRQVLASVMGQ